jgi:hypothetical protein
LKYFIIHRAVVSGAARKLFWEDGGLQLSDPAGVFVQLHLNDLIEAAIDGQETFLHLFADGGDVVFGCHMVDDVREHLTEFLECRFLSCHMPEV